MHIHHVCDQIGPSRLSHESTGSGCSRVLVVRKRGEWTLPIGELAAVGGAIGCAAVAGGGGQLGLGDGVSDRLVPTLVRGELQNKAVVQVAAADAVECGTDAAEYGVGGIPRDQQAAVAGAPTDSSTGRYVPVDASVHNPISYLPERVRLICHGACSLSGARVVVPECMWLCLSSCA